MPIDSEHPQYEERKCDWIEARDAYQGETAVKKRRVHYLPPTASMIMDGMGDNEKGLAAYERYLLTARFPGLVREAVDALLGVMHSKPPVIELPKMMEPLRQKATLRGESLDMVLQKINLEQLISGRCGLLSDFVVEGPRLGDPYLATYHAESIINWDDGRWGDKLNLVVLDESGDARGSDGFSWQLQNRYRVLSLGDLMAHDLLAEYRAGEFIGTTGFSEDAMRAPRARGRRPATEIPFTFINTRDITADTDDPMLLGLSKLAMHIYRGEADYRQTLYAIGQDTLVVIGSEEDKKKPLRTGAGAVIYLPGGVLGVDAKYIGVSGEGLPEQRTALENDYDRGHAIAGKLLDNTSREKESGEALRVRVAARTATLHQVAKTGAGGMQDNLRMLARWMGAEENQVVVNPNLDFVDDEIDGEEVEGWVVAKSVGAPISLESIHERMQERGATKLTFQEELKRIDDEIRKGIWAGVSLGSTAKDGPIDDAGAADATAA